MYCRCSLWLLFFQLIRFFLQRERQNVNTTIAKVVTYIEKDWDSDEELSPEPLLAALYSPKNIYASIINGVLSEKHSLDGQVAISNKLYSNQSVFVYDKKEPLSLLLRRIQIRLQVCPR